MPGFYNASAENGTMDRRLHSSYQPDIQFGMQIFNPPHVERVQCGTPTGLNGNYSEVANEFS
jgi:hypothetical protein